MSGRPLIGVCAANDRVQWRGWNEEATLLPRAYARAIQRAGAVALVLPPDDAAAEDPDELLDLLDGLVLSGGVDIDPGAYGARPHELTVDSDPARDRFELALAWRALERDLPVLGVCRGMELLNVATGGTLVQDLGEAHGEDRHRGAPNVYARHEVRLAPGSLAPRAAGAERHAVMSYHHQGPEELGEGVVASGWSLPDELVEAIEVPDRRFALGVLWHPEEDEASRVIGALVAEARRGPAAAAVPLASHSHR